MSAGLCLNYLCQKPSVQEIFSVGDICVEKIKSMRDLAMRDLSRRDLAMRDLAMRDLAMKDLVMRDLAMRDLSTRDLSMRDLSRRNLTRKNICNLSMKIDHIKTLVKEHPHKVYR